MRHTSVANGQRGLNRQPVGRRHEARRLAAGAAGTGVEVVGVGGRPHEQLGVRVLGVLRDGLAVAALHDASRVHHHRAVGEVAGRRDVVRDVEDRDLQTVAQVTQQVEDAEADRHVEHRDRLVGEQDLRVRGQGAGDRDALPLTTGQLVRELVDVPLGGPQVHAVEQLGERLLQLVAAQAAAVDLQAARQRVADRVHGVQRRERVLEDHLDLATRTAGSPRGSSSSRPRRSAGSGRRSGASAGRAAARSSTCRSPTRPRGRRPGRGRARGRRRRPRARPSSSGTRGRGSTCGSTRPAGPGSAPGVSCTASSPCSGSGLAWGQSSAHLGRKRCVRAGGARGCGGEHPHRTRGRLSSGHHRAEHLTTTRDHRRLSWRA